LFIACAVEAIRYVNRKQRAWAKTLAQPTSSIVDANLPLVVEVVTDAFKHFRIENNGKVPIEAIQVFATKYELDEKAFDQSRVMISNFYRVFIPILQIDKLDADTKSDTFNLTEKPFSDYLEFAEFPDAYEYATPKLVINYALRITFRDSRTGTKLVLYKVIGGVKYLSLFEEPSAAGTPQRVFFADIPIVIINHQRELFGNDAKEYTSP
jgi:hypothetical protein